MSAKIHHDAMKVSSHSLCARDVGGSLQHDMLPGAAE